MEETTISILVYGAFIAIGVAAYIQIRMDKKARNTLFEKKQPTDNSSIFGPYKSSGKGASK